MRFIPFKMSEYQHAYPWFRAGLFDVIDQALGWDEEFQYERFHKNLPCHWFYWVRDDTENEAVICYHHDKETLHLHLLVVPEANQKQGIGFEIISQLKRQAFYLGKSLTLSCFKNNHAAIALYRKAELEIVGEDDLFWEFASVKPSSLK
ncbi:GNAT family N-acetyltransferase [Vibrio nitrifigilis]|uniref:GNAT family N-acetyltransferase n=1 Tax=Vibrio nitrifigilis TaxID=2789781 RepID=A0ABS0GDP2_9VIBR|nr:GNAT family N-acetyltransferase [Vibrio nitrifigilis]MBF9000368.1 GNAT family N-acetyltransferase [Vibrio nitrifigilis]